MARPALDRRSSSGMRQLRARLAFTDLAIMLWATFGAQLIRFGSDGSADLALTSGALGLDYTTFSLLLAAVWWMVMHLHDAYDASILGHGATEYRLVIRVTLQVFAGVALLGFALQVQVARGYILIALPAGIIGLMLGRRLWRLWLGGQRGVGLMCSRVLVVGDPIHATQMIEAFASEPHAGYVPIGVCTTTDGHELDGITVLGEEREAARVAVDHGVDVVACTTSARLGTAGLRRLGWALEGSGIDLVVNPGLTEIAGPRVLTRPVAGLPLLHVESPAFSGPKLVWKSVVDWCGALALILLFAPVLIATAVTIRLHDGGKVFFLQERVGLRGKPFMMVKFRSMVPDAQSQHAKLQDRQRELTFAKVSESGSEVDAIDRGLMFKMENDPRVTGVGRFIRRYSIDELPQLFNVLTGSMSLVGPRPPLPDEVAQYAEDVQRRLLVKPGMTGLWQINGRSNLTWEESVRFDLYYVENWSIAQDLIILWRTASAVLRKDGAY